jgi:hypothetical protein
VNLNEEEEKVAQPNRGGFNNESAISLQLQLANRFVPGNADRHAIKSGDFLAGQSIEPAR